MKNVDQSGDLIYFYFLGKFFQISKFILTYGKHKYVQIYTLLSVWYEIFDYGEN